MYPDADWTIPGRINIDERRIIDHRPLYEGDEFMSLYGWVSEQTGEWTLGGYINSFNWLYKPMVF